MQPSASGTGFLQVEVGSLCKAFNELCIGAICFDKFLNLSWQKHDITYIATALKSFAMQFFEAGSNHWLRQIQEAPWSIRGTPTRYLAE